MIAIARAKATKEDARYEPIAKGPDYCGICVYFRNMGVARNSCTKVEGFISTGGWSRFFKRKGKK